MAGLDHVWQVGVAVAVAVQEATLLLRGLKEEGRRMDASKREGQRAGGLAIEVPPPHTARVSTPFSEKSHRKPLMFPKVK